MKSKVLFCTALLVLSVFTTSCDPDIIDAFADGYREGYYGTRTSTQPTSTDNGVDNNDDIIEE
ncbi:MAG: hypothetical protein K2H95_00160, partial [Bacteroidales bacterium]|nr:hypothetical protein [Bacteroidales bacterium]MDE6148256.1 hypothetical protein [Bacteroidales bacterium]